MTAKAASSAPARFPRSRTVLGPAAFSPVALRHVRKMEISGTIRDFNPDTFIMPMAARQDREPVCPAGLQDIQIIREAFRQECRSGMALETLPDHVGCRG